MDMLIPVLVQLLGGAAGGIMIVRAFKGSAITHPIGAVVGTVAGLIAGQVTTFTGLMEQARQTSSPEMTSLGLLFAIAAVAGAVATAIVTTMMNSRATPHH